MRLFRSAAPLRLIVDGPAPGDWNMAVDEMLLESAAESGTATLRLYEWSEPTLSLGYFQSVVDRRRHPPSLAVPLVRRASGGGAILHDRELTYSISLPNEHPLAADPETLYRTLHRSLIELLAEFGVVAELNPRSLVGLGGEPFLCFQRRSVGDLVIGEHKVCGSAQRRAKRAMLQHGSLLLARSAAAPELPGLCEIADLRTNVDVLAGRWRARLADSFALAAPTGLTTVEAEKSEEIRRRKFAEISWTNRR